MAATVVCFWAASFVFIKIALIQIPPITLAFARFAVATPILLAITERTRSSREAMKHALTRDTWSFVLMGLVGVTFLYVFQVYSLRLISATAGSVIINLHAVFAMLLSAAFLNEPLTSRKTSGVFVAFLGVILMTVEGSANTSLNLVEPVGALLMVAAALCWASYSVLGKRVLQRYSNQVVTSCAFLLGTLFLVPFAVSEGRLNILLHLSLLTWISVLFLAIPCSVIAYILWNHMITTIDVTKVLVSLYLIPIPTAILSYFVLRETVTYPLAIGAALVIAGICLTQSSKPVR
ncbi:MAG TPA: DMT family transporter [Terriglobales bacterium]|nr:DMT family transporter [Terriglobales bacterium]